MMMMVVVMDGDGWIDIMHGLLSIYSCNAW